MTNLRHGAACAIFLTGLAAGSMGCGAADESAGQPESGVVTSALSGPIQNPLPRVSSRPIGTAAVAAALPTPIYGRGAVISPELVTLYWGSFTQAEQTSMQAYITGLANYMSGGSAPYGQEPTVRSYGVLGATVGVTFRDTTLPSRGGVSGHAIEADAQAKISALQATGSLPAYSSQRVFVIFSKGITWDQVVDGLNYPAWCAYHRAFGNNQYFTINPMPTASQCGSVAGIDLTGINQAMASHEIFEAATDPGAFVTTSGWTLSSGAGQPMSEIADACQSAADMVPFSFGRVTNVFDRLTNACSTYTFHQGPGSSVVSWAPGRLDVMAVGGSQQLYHRYWSSGSSGWLPGGAWEPRGGPFLDQPVVSSWGANRLDIVGEGFDHAYYHQYFSGSGWGPSETGWEPHGGSFQGPPTVTNWSANRIDVIGRGTDGAYYRQAWDGSNWQPSQTSWESHGGVFISPPATVSWGANRLDIFGQGMDGAYYHQAWNGSSWQPSRTSWENHGGTFIGPPVVVSWGANRLDIFGQGTDGAYYHQGWNGSSWQPSQTGWERHGGVFVGQPGVTAWGPNRLDVFGQTTDRMFNHQYWSGSTWGPSLTGWEQHGGAFETGPAVTTWNGANSLAIFGSQINGGHYFQDWNGTDWLPSQTTYTALLNLSGL